MISSFNKKYRCCSQGCNRKVSYCCPETTCKNRICKRCFDALDENIRNFIKSHTHEEVNESHNQTEFNDTKEKNHNYECNSCDDISITSSNESIDLYRELNEQRGLEIEDEGQFVNGINTTTSFDNINEENFLVYSEPSDFPTEDDEDIIDEFPTTHAGDFPLVTEENLQNNRISVNGHVILNQACTLLSRQDKSI